MKEKRTTSSNNGSDPLGEWQEHLEELRKRLLCVLTVFFLASLAAFILSDLLASFLIDPLTRFHVKLYTFSPAEKFMAYMSLSVWTGAVLTLPFLLLQTGLFIWPALRGKEFFYALLSLLVVPLLFLGGAALCYRFIAPLAFGFFLNFAAGDGIEQMWGLRDYISLLFSLMMAAGLLLQCPLIFFALLLTNVISVRSAERGRPYAILAIFAAAAFLTPPDVVSQVMLGLPIYLLFETALLMAKILKRQKG